MNRSMRQIFLLSLLCFGFFNQTITVVELPDASHVRVNVSILVVQEGKVMLGLYKNSNEQEEGVWTPPGGLLEFGESLVECAIRHVEQEAGIEVFDPQLYAVTNDVYEDGTEHNVTLFMITGSYYGDVRLLEPEKCEMWAWFDTKALPENLFIPFKNLLGVLQQQQEN